MVRISTFSIRQLGPLGTALLYLAVAALIVLAFAAFVVAIPILLVAAAVVVAWTGLTVVLRRARGPNGMLDGRRNVRVRTPSDQ